MNKDLQIPSEKNFGTTFGIILILLSIIFKLNIFLTLIGISLIVSGLFSSKILKLLNYIWFKIGNLFINIIKLKSQ